MTAQPSLRPAIVKEVRASFPVLAAAVTAMIATAVLAGGRYRSIGILAYAVGAASLGALAFGHEFSLGTIQPLLTAPRSRRSTMTIKLGVLVTLLLPLAVIGHLFTFEGHGAERDVEITVLFWAPLVTAVGLGPWLTLLFGSATAGMAFSLAMPGLMFCGALIVWVATHGGFRPVPQSFVFRAGLVGTLFLSAVGVVLGWKSFQRLEVIEDRSDLGVMQWLRRDAAPVQRDARRYHPLLLLVRKELHLQRMTFVVAGAYVLARVLVILAKPLLPTELPDVLTIFYVGFLPFMPGALASADEHQLGTIEWQTCLPVAVWKQWLVKVAVVLGVAVGLAVGVPAVLSGTPDWVLFARLGGAVLMLATGSLYVSSACQSSLRALLTAIIALAITAPLAASAGAILYPHPIDLPAASYRILAGVSVGAAVLPLAMFNHYTARGGALPAWRHAAAAAGCAVCTAVALTLAV